MEMNALDFDRDIGKNGVALTSNLVFIDSQIIQNYPKIFPKIIRFGSSIAAVRRHRLVHGMSLSFGKISWKV